MVKAHLRAVAAALGLLATMGIASADELSITYTLSFDQPETGIAHVTAHISGLSSAGLELVRPAAAQGWFDNVRATDAGGNEVTVAPAEGGFYITTAGRKSVTVTYTIFPGALGPHGHLGLICADYAALDGALVFLVPTEEHALEKVELLFSAPERWRPAISWPRVGTGYRPNEAFAPLRLQLQRSLICLGDLRKLSKGFGTNTLSVWALDSYGQEQRKALAEEIGRTYGRIYELLGFETDLEYNIVCLPAAPDGLPVVAGAWVDGMAMTLGGSLPKAGALRSLDTCAHYLTAAYFAEQPFGVRLADEDWWFYLAVFRHGAGLGLIAAGRADENSFYSPLYTDYAIEASADNSIVDIPFSQARSASGAAQAFLHGTKAAVLAARLDFEIRSVTRNTRTLDDLIRAVYQRGSLGVSQVRVLDVIAEVFAVNFDNFYDRFIRSRSLILPTWPSFIEAMKKQTAEGPGRVAATVDGVPIYESEVETLAADMVVTGSIAGPQERRDTALAVLADEKLMDKALAQRRISVVPEVFWQLRTSLPGRVMRLIITKKRQALKETLYDEWYAMESETARIDVKKQTQEQSDRP